MPKKGHRAAARQAQLKRRRSRDKVHPQEFDPGPTESTRRERMVEPLLETDETDVQPETALETAQPSRPPARRARQRPSSEAPAVYRHLGTELRHIGMITGFIIAILVALTFVLGD